MITSYNIIANNMFAICTQKAEYVGDMDRTITGSMDACS